MKQLSKFFLAGLLLMSVSFLFSCERTRDALGLDGMYNAVKSNNWNSVKRQIGTDIGATIELVPDGGFAKFFDSKIQIFDENENPTGVDMTYSFRDTKTMVIDGADYQIQENFVSSIKKITAVSKNGGQTTYTFTR